MIHETPPPPPIDPFEKKNGLPFSKHIQLKLFRSNDGTELFKNIQPLLIVNKVNQHQSGFEDGVEQSEDKTMAPMYKKARFKNRVLRDKPTRNESMGY